MPLPGGPSDKLGNRYELRWVVLQLVELLTGHIEWLRVETPGEDAIEFRRRRPSGDQEAYQAKRGRAQTGRWTIAALRDVLLGFRELLRSEPTLTCVFVSEHTASELAELSERARASISLDEFSREFLAAGSVKSSWDELRSHWNVDETATWTMLRRIKVITVSESYLIDTVDQTLGLLLNAAGMTGRAVLTELALESVHRELTASDVISYLGAQSIQIVRSPTSTSIAINVVPPPSGVKRAGELKTMHEAIADGASTIFIAGLSGIGKSTLAAQFSAEWSGPTCWVDCELLTTELEVLGHIAEYLKTVLKRPVLSGTLANGRSPTTALAKLAGRELASLQCLVIWDGLEDSTPAGLRKLVMLVSAANTSGAQIVTAQHYAPVVGVANVTTIHLERLSPADERSLFLVAFPEARLPDLEKAASLTNGYPYLIQLLCGAAQTLDFHSAIEQLAPGRTLLSELLDTFLLHLPDAQRRSLVLASWLGVPFSSEHLESLGVSLADLHALASRHLVLRLGPSHYRVHALLTDLIARSTTPYEQHQLHERAATVLSCLNEPTWIEMRAVLMHARKASLSKLADEAAQRLLDHAISRGHWQLAGEAATAIVDQTAATSPPRGAFYAHFVLGKHARINENAEKALEEYGLAEEQAPNETAGDTARYERASVMLGLGREDEARGIYEKLANSAVPGTQAESLIAIGMMLARNGDLAVAEEKIREASAIATAAALPREEAEANQALGEILSDAGRYEDAIKYLRQAHSLRLSIQGPSDVYGWFHLMHRIVLVERQLGNTDRLASATRAMWRVACASGNLAWEAESAFAMCQSSLDTDSPEVELALDRLRARSGSMETSSRERLRALHGLVLCSWTIDRFTDALEAILDSIALSTESELPSAVYAHYRRARSDDPKVVATEEGPFFLSLPEAMDEGRLLALVSEIMERRPELAQYAGLLVAKRKDVDTEEGD